MTIHGDGEFLVAGGPIMLGGMNKRVLVRVRDAGDHRTVAFRAKSWDDKVEALIQTCR